MKPFYKTICCLFFLLTFSFVSTAQYVNLEGKQFKDENGANFYPMVTEYVFTVIHNANPATAATDYLLARSSSYGPCTDYLNCYNESSTEANLLQEIKNDFDVIHQMGFNTIRTAGIGPEFEYAVLPSSGFTLIGAPPLETDFMQGAVLNDHNTWAGQPMKISTNPNDNDPYREQLFHFIDEILEAAYDKQLKVMLDVGYGKVTNNVINGSTYDHFTAYKNYLTLLAEHIVALPDNLKKTLVAYAIVEEPTTEGEGQDGNTKQSVCDKTNQMYDLLKSIDPNHLITIGSFNLTDLTEWDPGVMKLDFWSPHFYAYPFTDFELDADAAVNRVKHQIYWLKDNCPMPWIIGETSFAAIDDEWYDSADRHYPEVNGELEGSFSGEHFNQKNYAQEMLAYVRDCGGSGFSWWEFQELSWGNPTDDGYGLLRHGEAITDYSAIRKPVVDAFENYLDVNGEPPAPNPANAIPPTNYYDPNNFDAITPNSLYRYTGTITDQTTGLPIKDALIYGWTEYTLYDPDPLNITHQKVISEFFFTYSQPDGSYVINLEHPNVDYSFPNGFFRVNNLLITTSGAERWQYGWMETGMPANLQLDVALKRNSFSFDDLVDNQTLTNGTINQLMAWNSLTVSGTTTTQAGSTSTFTARKQVQVTGEFHAETGSEVHIYNSESFQDCPDFTDFLKINPNVAANTSSSTDELAESKFIEVNFTTNKSAVYLSVQPNPSKGLFTLELNSATNTVETNEPFQLAEVKIRSVMGNLIYYNTFSGNKTQLDLTAFGKGIYLVQVKTNNQFFNQKMIIQ